MYKYDREIKDTTTPMSDRKTVRKTDERMSRRQISSKGFNHTGIPLGIQERFESMAGLDLDDVKVHYNSDKPEQLQALAYTQGNQIYIAPGQEKHLEHELGHVIQQKQGKVKPTGSIGGLPLNDDADLERAANLLDDTGLVEDGDVPVSYTGQGSGVVQRYVKAGGYTMAAQPADAPGQRLLMVKDNEPGALYIHTSVDAAVIPAELARLGIAPSAVQVDSPLANQNPEGRFTRYEQQRIPQIFDKVPELQEVPDERLSWWQKLCCCANPMETVYRDNFRNPQPDRSEAMRQKAEERLGRQQQFADNALHTGGQLLHGIQANNLAAHDAAAIKERLEDLLGAFSRGGPEAVISVRAMGSDMLHSVHALYEVARQVLNDLQGGAADGAPPAEAGEVPVAEAGDGPEVEAGEVPVAGNRGDWLQILDMVLEDIEYRRAQVQAEFLKRNLDPHMPSGCSASALRRSKLSYGVDNHMEMAQFEKIATKFDHVIGWNYHYASKIPAQGLTSDTLIIEDAVGKSSDEREMLNAHWGAHIYGSEELLQDAGQNPLTLLQGVDAAAVQPMDDRESQCRFNNMQPGFRHQFFDSHHIRPNDQWTMNYIDVEHHLPMGKLEFYINDNEKIAYRLIPFPGQAFTPAMQHFLIVTADAIAEDFAIKGFTATCPIQVNAAENGIAGLRWNKALAPPTRDTAHYYPLEELR